MWIFGVSEGFKCWASFAYGVGAIQFRKEGDGV